MSSRLITKVNYWLNNIQFSLLPGTCIHCHRDSHRHHDLCLDCEIALPVINDPCQSCGLPLPANNYDGHSCGSCIIDPPPFEHLISAFEYSAPVNDLITAFKYRGKLAFGRVLTQLLLQSIRHFYTEQPLPELLILNAKSWQCPIVNLPPILQP